MLGARLVRTVPMQLFRNTLLVTGSAGALARIEREDDCCEVVQ